MINNLQCGLHMIIRANISVRNYKQEFTFLSSFLLKHVYNSTVKRKGAKLGNKSACCSIAEGIMTKHAVIQLAKLLQCG